MFTDTLGDWLELQRRRADFWLKLLILALILLVLANVIVRPEPHEQPIHPAGHIEEGTQLEDPSHGPATLEHGEEQSDAHGAVDTHGEAATHDSHGAADTHGAADNHGAADAHGAAGGHAQGFFDVDAPHFVLDKWPGFWPAFSLLASVGMILVLKKVVAKVLGRREDFYAE